MFQNYGKGDIVDILIEHVRCQLASIMMKKAFQLKTAHIKNTDNMAERAQEVENQVNKIINDYIRQQNQMEVHALVLLYFRGRTEMVIIVLN